MSSTENYDQVFKILLIGDSGVGKSCLLTRFTKDSFSDASASTIGVDFRVKYSVFNNQKCKLTIWDTAGQERFRTLTSSYYRGAQGIIFVYDVSRRDTFENLEGVWMREADMYGTVEDAIKMVVANKVDLDTSRQVSKEEGLDFARKHGCLFVETSAKINIAVSQAFEELVEKILETPSLLDPASSSSLKLNQAATAQVQACSC